MDKKEENKINPTNKDDKCFQYAATVSLNYGRIKSHPERVSNNILFINKYNWDGIKYSSKIDDRKTSKKIHLTSTFNVSYIKEREICPAYISLIHSDSEKSIIFLMFPNEEKGWHCIAVKTLPALLRGRKSKHQGDFYCLNCLYSFGTKNKLKNKYLCRIVTPSPKGNILQFNQYMKPDKCHTLFMLTLNL